jgi:hypothetical protein
MINVMARRSWVLLSLIASMSAYAADPRPDSSPTASHLGSPDAKGVSGRPRVLSFADENWLTMAIGEFNHGQGWVQSTDFYSPPQPGDVVTLFGTQGKLGEVTIQDERRPIPEGTNAGWSARVERGTTMRQPFALAIQGSWPDTGPDSQELALDDPANVRMVSDYLKDHGLKVETPFLTQAFQADLLGDGHREVLLCAHSDTKALTDDQEAVVYALALLHFGPPGKEETIALASQAAYKPAGRSIDAFEHLYGTRDFYRFIAFHDIEGDGHKEIVLYRAKDLGTQTDVFTFDGHRVQQVLSAYKPGYN